MISSSLVRSFASDDGVEVEEVEKKVVMGGWKRRRLEVSLATFVDIVVSSVWSMSMEYDAVGASRMWAG